MDKLFLYNESNVRTSKDENGIDWFAGIDVCNILGYAKADKTITSKLDEDERKLGYLTSTSGQRRKGWKINESGLYSLILSSTKPEAKVFRKWITSVVIPSLRKAGVYSTDSLNRKNVVVQELIKMIEEKEIATTASKTTTKKLEKGKALLQTELMQVLKSDPDQISMYSEEVMETLKIDNSKPEEN